MFNLYREKTELEDKLSMWKTKYEDLYQKVRPFQEQLDAFEAERLSLMSYSKNARSEIDKLSKDYAKLLGHQNQKQKIHHVMKLKEDNISLKEVNFISKSMENVY